MFALNAPWFNKHARADAEGGLRFEGTMVLPAGHVIFRFVLRSDARDRDCIRSPWWFQTPALRIVLRDARAAQHGDASVASQARKKAALSETWAGSGAHYLLAARVSAPLKAIYGPPRPVGRAAGEKKVTGLTDHAHVDAIDIVPDPRCVQLYIPGMRDETLSHKAVRVISRNKFKNDRDLLDGEVEAFLRRSSHR